MVEGVEAPSCLPGAPYLKITCLSRTSSTCVHTFRDTNSLYTSRMIVPQLRVEYPLLRLQTNKRENIWSPGEQIVRFC